MAPEESDFDREINRRALDTTSVPSLLEKSGLRDVILHPMTFFAALAATTTLAAPWVSESMGTYMGSALKMGLSTYPAYLAAALPLKAIGTGLGRDWFDKDAVRTSARVGRDFLGSIGLFTATLGLSEIISANTPVIDTIVQKAGMHPATTSTLVEMTEPTNVMHAMNVPVASHYLGTTLVRFQDFFRSFSNDAVGSSVFTATTYAAVTAASVMAGYYVNKTLGNPVGRAARNLKDFLFSGKDRTRSAERTIDRSRDPSERTSFLSKALALIKSPFNRSARADSSIPAPDFTPPMEPAAAPSPTDVHFIPFEDLDRFMNKQADAPASGKGTTPPPIHPSGRDGK